MSVPAGIAQMTDQSRGLVEIKYNHAAGSYTISEGGRETTFTAADRRTQSFEGEVSFFKSASSEYLTLVTTPYMTYGALPGPNKYVGMGYWQANDVSPGLQQTDFTSFVYGFDSPAKARPTNGTGTWLVDIFGMLTERDVELRTIQGAGDFVVDFGQGVYKLRAYVNEYDFVSGGGRTGSLSLDSGGALTSGNGFSGPLSYEGGALVHGTLEGRFYGPAYQEIGATFNAQSGDAVLTGALTGQQSNQSSTTDGFPNITLTDIVNPGRIYGATAGILRQVNGSTPGFASVSQTSGTDSVDFGATGPEILNMNYALEIDAANKVSSSANFDNYEKSVNGQNIEYSLYRIGSANTEVALTYTSFASVTIGASLADPGPGVAANRSDDFLLYGLATPRHVND
ncbi:MAG: hypothetical protein EOO39_34975 [Cytophagaceae bacterium]|nr:MAG: hypothetical protein EOO39_34975 [Cytophagaceae bacterium]